VKSHGGSSLPLASYFTDVVEIPDVFLPAEEYLDMFDSESDSSGDLGHSDSDAELVEVS
jgi:hypothetical protein